MPLNLPSIARTVLDEYSLSPDGDHGVSHWARVLENGLRLAETTDANIEVVQLFALFHDSKRVKETSDPGHGQRGADFAAELWEQLFSLPDHEFGLLYRACAGHTDEPTHPNITVQTCWDADRLDLGRVGVMPHPSRLCTEAARDPAMIKWADGRASFGVVPKLVTDEWEVEVGKK
jgi:uncharacterized protein